MIKEIERIYNGETDTIETIVHVTREFSGKIYNCQDVSDKDGFKIRIYADGHKEEDLKAMVKSINDISKIVVDSLTKEGTPINKEYPSDIIGTVWGVTRHYWKYPIKVNESDYKEIAEECIKRIKEIEESERYQKR